MKICYLFDMDPVWIFKEVESSQETNSTFISLQKKLESKCMCQMFTGNILLMLLLGLTFMKWDMIFIQGSTTTLSISAAKQY